MSRVVYNQFIWEMLPRPVAMIHQYLQVCWIYCGLIAYVLQLCV